MGVAFGSRIKGTWEVVGLGAGGPLACLPDLSGLTQTLRPEAGLGVFPVAVLEFSGGSSLWLGMTLGYLHSWGCCFCYHKRGRFVYMGYVCGSEPAG